MVWKFVLLLFILREFIKTICRWNYCISDKFQVLHNASSRSSLLVGEIKDFRIKWPFWILSLMFHVVMAPERWPQHHALPSCCEQVSDGVRKLKVQLQSAQIACALHYRNVVFYTVMSFDQNFTISQKKKAFSIRLRRGSFKCLWLCSIKLLVSLFQVSVITILIFLKPKGIFVFIFFYRGQCYIKKSWLKSLR